MEEMIDACEALLAAPHSLWKVDVSKKKQLADLFDKASTLFLELRGAGVSRRDVRGVCAELENCAVEADTICRGVQTASLQLRLVCIELVIAANSCSLIEAGVPESGQRKSESQLLKAVATLRGVSNALRESPPASYAAQGVIVGLLVLVLMLLGAMLWI